MHEIPGWFGFAKWYDFIAEHAPHGATLVELGVFCGKSLAHLARATRGKGCRVFGVDTFLGSPEFDKTVRFVDGRAFDQMFAGELAGVCVNQLHGAGVLDDVTLLVTDSAKAAHLFAYESVFSVFVDAGHDADSVERDVKAWWPRIMPGGWIAGDDYDRGFPGVREGLLRVFPAEVLPPDPPENVSYVWHVQKPVE